MSGRRSEASWRVRRGSWTTWRHPLIRWGIPHLYVSYAGYLCFAYCRGNVWTTGIVGRGYKVWRER